jgi:asparagine synthetase B (glutamine-hydrolysing)
MFGITGFYSKNLLTFNNVIWKMNLAIAHRGSDSNNVSKDNNSGSDITNFK